MNRPLDKDYLNCKDRQAQRCLYRHRIAADHKRAELALQRQLRGFEL